MNRYPLWRRSLQFRFITFSRYVFLVCILSLIAVALFSGERSVQGKINIAKAFAIVSSDVFASDSVGRELQIGKIPLGLLDTDSSRKSEAINGRLLEIIQPPSTSVGDVAVNVGNLNLYKLKAGDGTILWGPTARANCGGLAVDQVDLGVYAANSPNCGGGGVANVYKYDPSGGQSWSTPYAGCGTAGNYYIGNGGIAVDTTSATPGVVLAKTGFYGDIGKVSRVKGSTIFCNGTNDLGRPTIDPANGQIYAITRVGTSYNTIYSATATGTLTSAASCQGPTDLNPADGNLYRGCGTTLYQINKSSLGSTVWSLNLSALITAIDSVAVQPWSGGYIYVGGVGSAKIVVVNPATQSVVTSFTPAVGPASMAVNPNGGNVYVANATNFVYAYGPTGTLVWTSPDLGGPVYNLAAAQGIVGTAPVAGPEIDIRGGSPLTSIVSGDLTPSLADGTDFGSTAITGGTVSHTFTIANTGSLDLLLTTTPKVVVVGANPADFTVTLQPTSPVAPTTGTTTFTIVFDPIAAGVRNATLTIGNNDADENPYTFAISGTGAVSSTSTGDLAVNVGGTTLYRLKGVDGTIIWGPVGRTNCGGLAVDQADLSVYTADSPNCGPGYGPANVFKYDPSGVQSWSTAYAGCGGAGNYYIGNGGIAVDTTSGTPGVVLTKTGFFGDLGKVSRLTGSTIFCDSTNDLGRPTIDPANGQIYAITHPSTGYNTIYSATATGTLTSAASCQGPTDLNPADGNLYRGCGTTLYQMNKSSLGTTVWSLNLSALITAIDSIAVQQSSGGYIYVGGVGSTKIVVVNPVTQSVVTSFTPAVGPASMATNPINGNVYVANATNFVYAYTQAGALTWTSPNLGGPVYSLAAPRNVGGVAAPPAPEIDIRGGSPLTSIVSGDLTPSLADGTDFGSTAITGGTVSHTFTIANTGSLDLLLTTTPKVVVVGANPADFTVTLQPTSPVAPTTGTTTFTIVFDPIAAGVRNATLTIGNNDADENPYTFAISGTGAVSSTSTGDLAVNVGGTTLYRLKGVDGTIIWGPVGRTNCGGLAVDQADLSVYTADSPNCGPGYGPANVFKYDPSGVQSWSTAYAGCGGAGNYYIGNGGIAVDTTSGTPGVVLTKTGFFGDLGKVSRLTGSTIFCDSTNDLGRPTIDPANGQIYAITHPSTGYNTLYSATTPGVLTSAASCQGPTDLSPADDNLYRGCGTTLYQMNKNSLGATIWSLNLAGLITGIDSIAVQQSSGGYIFVGGVGSSRVVVVNPATQSIVTSFVTAIGPGSMATNPVNGNVYIANATNFVYAYTQAGALAWTSPDLGGPVYNVAAPRNFNGGTGVSISGHVYKPGNSPLTRGVVTITTYGSSARRYVVIGAAGAYQFPNLPAGQFYTIKVGSRGYYYAQQSIFVTGPRTDVDFIGQ